MKELKVNYAEPPIGKSVNVSEHLHLIKFLCVTSGTTTKSRNLPLFLGLQIANLLLQHFIKLITLFILYFILMPRSTFNISISSSIDTHYIFHCSIASGYGVFQTTNHVQIIKWQRNLSGWRKVNLLCLQCIFFKNTTIIVCMLLC